MRGSVSDMRFAWNSLVLAACGFSALGCMSQYVRPKASEPHAVVKFRRTYMKVAGVRLTEELNANDEWVLRKNADSKLGKSPRTDGLLLHPGRSVLELRAIFSHQGTRTRQQSYNCGSGDSPQTCYRTVTENYTIVDGACTEEMAVVIEDGKNYLLSLDYQDENNCSSSCLIQSKKSDGSFSNQPCERFIPKD